MQPSFLYKDELFWKTPLKFTSMAEHTHPFKSTGDGYRVMYGLLTGAGGKGGGVAARAEVGAVLLLLGQSHLHSRRAPRHRRH